MWWVMPITPALSETEAGGSPQTQDYPGLQGKTLPPNINNVYNLILCVTERTRGRWHCSSLLGL